MISIVLLILIILIFSKFLFSIFNLSKSFCLVFKTSNSDVFLSFSSFSKLYFSKYLLYKEKYLSYKLFIFVDIGYYLQLKLSLCGW